MTSSSPAQPPSGAPTPGSAHSAAPARAPVDVQRAAAVILAPLTPPRRRTGLLVIGIIAIAILAVAVLYVVSFLVGGLGAKAFSIGGFMAVIPLSIVFIGARWIDRWDPEPRGIILFAFLWGAGVSVLIALIVGAQIDNVIASLGGPGPGYEFFSSVIQAPIVEEGGKGLGLLLIFLVARKHFDGPVDGLVYAAWLAGGFAFTENILYFGSELVDAGGFDTGLLRIFFIRGLMSPFAHVMFTACMGVALGIAARRTNRLVAIGVFLLGLVPAVLFHALWNGALFSVNDFYGYYIAVQFPLFIGALLFVNVLRRQEARLTFERLSEYAAAGWFNPNEVTALATVNGRRQARAWAAQRGLGAVMKRYLRDATRLAFTRQRIVTGRSAGGAQADEAALLASIASGRAALQSAGTSAARQA